MDVEALVARYDAISPEQEAELVTHLIQAGWDAGCWLRPPPETLITATQRELEELLGRLSARPGFGREGVEDPFPNGRDHEPIEGEDSCHVVLSQRCDIVGLLKNEPLVELAPAAFCDDIGRIKLAWKNSPREFPVDPTTAAGHTHMVDLRYRYYISKLDLVDLQPVQALPRDTPECQVRLRFSLRAAQRYTRAAVPDKLVDRVVKPLGKLVAGDAEANELFTEWALFHGGRREEKPGLRAIYQSRIDESLPDDEQAEQEDQVRQAAEDKFQSIMEALPQEATVELDLDDDHRTRAVDERDLTVADWRLSWKLEWDAESFSGDPDAALPAR
jgi:hypothetical protein